MTYRNLKNIETLIAEGRVSRQEKALARAQAQARAEEIVRPLVAYLADRGITAALSSDRDGAYLHVQVSAPCWPYGIAENWRFLKIADDFAGVTPEAVERLASQPGFAACIDEYTTWRPAHIHGEEVRCRTVLSIGSVVVAAMLAALYCGYDPTTTTMLAIAGVVLAFIVGAVACDVALGREV